MREGAWIMIAALLFLEMRVREVWRVACVQ